MDKFWTWIITDVFSFIANYGLRVIVLTVCIKLLLYPLDFFQRKKTKDNTRKMKIMQPELERINRQYANDKQKLNEATMAIYRKHKYGMFYACLPMIITMFVFITLWSGFTTISQQRNNDLFDHLQGYYNEATAEYKVRTDGDNTILVEDAAYAEVTALKDEYRDYYLANFLKDKRGDKANKNISDEDILAEGEAILAERSYRQDAVFTAENTTDGAEYHKIYGDIVIYIGQKATLAEYENVKESFLWIKNIWRPDVFWSKPIPTASEFQKLTGATTINGDSYIEVMGMISNEYEDTANGWMILVVLAVGFNFLSSFMMQKQQKGSTPPPTGGGMGAMGGANTMKYMMYFMPVLIGIFALSYSAGFTIYMVTNAATTVLLNLVSTLIIKLLDKRREAKENEVAKVRHL